jgi:hypothetical protein
VRFKTNENPTPVSVVPPNEVHSLQVAKKATSIRLALDTYRLLIQLAELLCVNKTAVIALAIRALAAQHGLAATKTGENLAA